jgi:hypothetical protein
LKKKTEAKGRLVSYVPEFLIVETKRIAKMRRLTSSTIVETALKMVVNQSESDAVIDRRLNRLQRQYERIHKDQQILIETLVQFVKVNLALTPVISEEQTAEAERNGAERLKRFVEMVRCAYGEDKPFADLVQEKVFKEEDFKAEEDAQ